MRVKCPIFESASTFPQNFALQSPEFRWTYSELNVRIARLEFALRQFKLSKGSIVSIELSYTKFPSVIALIWALWRNGQGILFLDPQLPPNSVRELVSESRAILHFGNTKTDQCSHIPLSILETLASQSVYPESVQTELELDQIASLIPTSGSSGKSKIVGLSIQNLFQAAKGSNQFIQIDSSDSWLLALPLHHVSGLGIVWRCALSGATVLIPGKSQRWIDAIVQQSPSYISVVPTQLFDLIQSEIRTPAVKSILVGGAEISESLLRRAVGNNLPLQLSYGCSEMAGQVTTTEVINCMPTGIGYGTAVPNREIRISSSGEIEVRGDCLFKGYWENNVWIRPTTIDNWFNTGDHGTWSENGLVVLGRADFMYISGGKNVYPNEIEQAIGQIADTYCCVVPVPDNRFGQVGVAILPQHLEIPSIKTALTSVLPAYKIPKFKLDWPDEISIDSIKIPRKRLKEWALRQIDELKPF